MTLQQLVNELGLRPQLVQILKDIEKLSASEVYVLEGVLQGISLKLSEKEMKEREEIIVACRAALEELQDD